MLDQSHLAVWPYEVFSALVCVHHDRTSGEALCCFMPTSMACDELACCPNCCCNWARLVLSGWNLIVRGTIFFVHLLCQTTNNPVGCSTCLASLARPSSIRSGVEFSFSDYNLRSFCKHPRSMQDFLVTSGSPAHFAVSKGVVHFWAVCLHCLYFFVCSWWRKVTLMIWKDLNP